MWNGYYSKALKEFNILNELSPANPYVEKFIQKCRAEIDAGHDKKEVPMGLILGIIIGVLIVLAALFLMKRGGSKVPSPKPSKPKRSAKVSREANPGETVILGSSNTPLAYLINNGTGESFKLSDNTNIGRGEGNDIVLNDPAVSTEHAKVKFENEKFVLYDLASTNGTYVNGNKITKQELKDGDTVTFARVQMTFKKA